MYTACVSVCARTCVCVSVCTVTVWLVILTGSYFHNFIKNLDIFTDKNSQLARAL